MKRRGVLLDRDGVLNRALVRDGKPYPPATVDEVEILPGVAEALDELLGQGLVPVGVTNQPDVARGRQTREGIEAINRFLLERLPLREILVCLHDDADACECRKPRPGLLLEAAERHDLDLSRSFMVGDRWSDVEAGRAAGCLTFLVSAPYNEAHRCRPDFVVSGLPGAARQVSLLLSSSERRAVSIDGAPAELAQMTPPPRLRIKIFADGADKAGMLEMYRHPWVKGFTTNPTLMRQAGISDYEAFARDILEAIPDRPISFEVFSDDFGEMERQALKITGWASNVYVKIPVTNTAGESSVPVLRALVRAGVKLNVTAMMTLDQVRDVGIALAGGPSAFVSVFAGRIADSGRDPVPLMAAALEALRPYPNLELLWASPRELLNIVQADSIGCHIITATNSLITKLPLLGKDLDVFSLDTVKMFREDAVKAGYTL